MTSFYIFSVNMASDADPFGLNGNTNLRPARATSIPWEAIISLNNMHTNTQGMRDSLNAQVENDNRILTAVTMALTSAKLRLAASRTDAASSMQFLRMAEGRYHHTIRATRHLDHIETSLARVGGQSNYRMVMDEGPGDPSQETTALRAALLGLQSAKRESADEAREHTREVDAVVLVDMNEVLRLEHIVTSLQDSISSKKSLIDSLD